jgi:hypothetical protein
MVIFHIPDAGSFIIIVLDSESEMGEFLTRPNQNRKRNSPTNDKWVHQKNKSKKLSGSRNLSFQYRIHFFKKKKDGKLISVLAISIIP